MTAPLDYLLLGSILDPFGPFGKISPEVSYGVVRGDP